MSALPHGTLTFLFTDIQGSTRLWEREPEAMARAMIRHDLLFEAAVGEQHGHVVRPRGEGDSRFAVFPGAADAVTAATRFQVALHAETWPFEHPLAARIAMHTGEATLRDGDYYGTTVNRCARIRALAHGGQTLLSGLTSQLTRGQLPAGVTLLDLGEHELRDLVEPEHIYQLVIPGVPADFPPLASQTPHPHNLPAETTTFVGRDAEIAAIRERLIDPEVRLATLVGPGGVGKTRLALRVAHALVQDFEDGVFFVPLASLPDHTLILPAIVQTLDMHATTSDEPPINTLREHLRGKRLLLVLDNFDHLMDGSAQLAELLAACPQLKILITSREAPRLRGNREITVAPLGVPDPTRLPPLRELLTYASIRLFVERAHEIDPDFDVTAENAASIVAICQRLDGLPLAIELAAARIRLFTPQALLARLDRRLPLLTSGAQDLPARQQTLRNTIAWSYDLLEPTEQALFRRLAVFLNGFTLDAAEALCRGPEFGGLDVLTGVDSLVSKSLLRRALAAAGSNTPRFRMLQTIREFGQEHLEMHGEADAAHREHARFFLTLAEQAEPEIMRREQARWVAILGLEQDNLRAAVEWSFTAGESELALRLTGALWPFWEMRGYFAEGMSWLTRAQQLDGKPEWHARIMTGAGTFAWSQGDYDRATALHAGALALYRETGNRAGIAFALNNLGVQALGRADYDEANTLFQESLTRYREQDDGFGIADVLNNLGVVAQYQGHLNSADVLYQETLGMARKLGDDHRAADALYNLGDVAYYQHEYERAWDLYHESLNLRREIGSRWGAALCLAALAGVASAMGAYRRAARLAGAAQALFEETGYSLDATERSRFEQTMENMRAGLGAETSAALWTEGHMMTVDEALDYAAEALEPRPQPT